MCRGSRKVGIRSVSIGIAVCIFTDACTFAPRILESEKDDYLHRDTSSLNRLFYLLIYLFVAHMYYIYHADPLNLAMIVSFSFYFFSFAWEFVFTGQKKRLSIYIIDCYGELKFQVYVQIENITDNEVGIMYR